MKLDEKKGLDLFYTFLGVLFYYIKKVLFSLKINFNGINKSNGIVTKEQIKLGLNYYRNINYFDIDLSSSGTTGEPTTVWANPFHWISEQSAQYEYFTENGYRFRDKMIILRGYAPKDGEPFYKIDKIRNFIWISAFHLTENNIEIIKSFLNGNYFLRGYPSSIELLASLLKNETNLTNPKAIFTASETITVFQRNIVKKVFNVEIYDWYGTSEPSVIMFQTKKTFPVYKPPLFHCKVKYEDISNQSKNEKIILGKALWYNLSDFGFYRTNDVALINDTGDVLSIEGRKSDFIEISENKIPVTNLLTVLYSVPGVIRFQIVNNINKELLFLLSVEDIFVESELKIELDKRLGANNYNILITDSFRQSSMGKTPFFIKSSN